MANATRGIVVALTREEAQALIYSYSINEYPVSNPLGNAGPDILDRAEQKLKAALRDGS